MSGYGTVNDYRTGFMIREATAAEWRRTADKVSSGDSDSYTGAWADEDDEGRIVYVSGGPDTEIHPSDIAELADEAAAHGDHEMRHLCREALAGDDSDQNTAWDKCAEVIINNRMHVTETGEPS